MTGGQLLRFIRNPHVPWALLSAIRRRSLKLYRLVRYGSVNPNTRRYWNRMYAAEVARGDLRDHDYSALHSSIASHARPEDRILDVGCGTGALLRRFADVPGVELFGCDMSKVAVEAVKPLCVDARVVCLPDMPADWRGQFDLVSCTEVLEHLDKPEQAILAMARCLRSEGRLIVSVPDDCMHPEDIDLHVQSFDETRLKGLLLAAFCSVEFEHVRGQEENRYLVGYAGKPRPEAMRST